jgi:hypothetical protein
MSDSNAFDFAASFLEENTDLDRLEARGTLRIILKKAGLEAKSVDPKQMKVAVDRMLADELVARGTADPSSVVDRLSSGMDTLQVDSGGSTPEQVFARLGGS